MSRIEAACRRRVGAAQAATALFRFRDASLKQDQDQTLKASATKAAGYFLSHKQQKSVWIPFGQKSPKKLLLL
ncbi:hypothetical protein [Lysobacter antibioticus]|uniref:hypothetical protein n=1 Tax=Lysobacter antibioticus TaxID=84531 RepID=UPI001187332E|nr:hypothetical protein [Lysobacter antibioticus]